MFALQLSELLPFVTCLPVSQLPVLSSPVLRASSLLEVLCCCLGLPMASSTERGAARAREAPPPPLPPPPPEDVAAFYALVEIQVIACALSRHSRAAELCDRAASQAKRLWGDNSLVVADMRVIEVNALRSQALTSTSSSSELRGRAWAVLVPVHALLLRRLSDNTLLPGTIKEEEATYYARAQALVCKATDNLVPPEAVLQGAGVVLGYKTLLDAVCQTLNLLIVLRGSAQPRESAHSFVLTALDAIPRTATMQIVVPTEANLVATINSRMTPQNFEPSFCAAVLRKWRSIAVADVLRALGVLQTGVAAHEQFNAAFDARQRADI